MTMFHATPGDPLFGAIIKTKYAGKQLLRVFRIVRDCDCPTYLDEINLPRGSAPRTTPHLHFIAVPDDTPHREEYYDGICRYYNQIVSLGGGRFGDIPESRGWRFKYFILRVVGRDIGPSLFFQGDLFA